MILTTEKRAKIDIPFLLFSLGLLWMVLGMGDFTHSVNSLKFSPAFILISIAFLIKLLFIRSFTVSVKRTQGRIILLLGLSLLFPVFPGSIGGENYDFLYNSATRAAFLILALSSILIIDTHDKRKFILYLTIIMLMILSITGVLEATGIIFLSPSQENIITGGFNNPNLFAAILILLIPLHLPFFTLIKQKIYLIGMGFIIILSIVILLLTACRSAYISFLVALITGSYLYKKFFIRDIALKRKFLIIAICAVSILLLTGVSLPSIQNKIIRTMTNGEPRIMSFTAALRIWLHSLRSFLIGNGIGSFRRLLPQYSYSWYLKGIDSITSWHAVHNEYLEILVEGGLLGFTLFFLLILNTSRYYFISFKNDMQITFDNMLSLGIIMSASAFLTDALFSTSFREPQIAGLFYIILFMNLNLETENVEEPLRKTIRYVILLPMIALIVFSQSRQLIRIYTDRVLFVNSKIKNEERKITLLEICTSLEPQYIIPAMELSREYLKQGEIGSFLEAADNVEKLIPSFLDINYLRGFVFTNKKEHYKAIAAYKKHLSAGDYDLKGERALLFSYLWINETEKALDVFKTIIEKDRKNFFQKEYEVIFSDFMGINISTSEITRITVGEDYILNKLIELSENDIKYYNEQYLNFHLMMAELYQAASLSGSLKHHNNQINRQRELLQSVP